MDDLYEIRQEIAYRRWQLTGCEDSDINWREAGKILIHFIRKRPESYFWKQEHEDYSLYADLVGGNDETDTKRFTPRPKKDSYDN